MEGSNEEHDKQEKESSTIIELVLKAERLCKIGDIKEGIEQFEQAVAIGTSDVYMLSAIYSQLGNAYFYVGDYKRALQYHRLDLNLNQRAGNNLAEAKASGNIGHTLKFIGKYDDAVICFKRQLELSRQISNKIGESRALYNLGNAYHEKGKLLIHKEQRTPNSQGHLGDNVISILENAVNFYEANLDTLNSLINIDNNVTKGRTYGNLGNTHYLLCNFQLAIQNHEKRLEIALITEDVQAQRRAHTNLGNSYIFLGNYSKAMEHYKRCLQLAKQLNELILEAVSCYNLGNTFTLLKDYHESIKYHIMHLKIVQQLNDRRGQARACWSLGAAFTANGEYKVAHEFAVEHLVISKEINDATSVLSAEKNIADLCLTLQSMSSSPPSSTAASTPTSTPATSTSSTTSSSSSAALSSPRTPGSSCYLDDSRQSSQQHNQFHNLSCEAIEAKKALHRRRDNMEKTPQRSTRHTSMENLNLLKLTPKQNTLFHQIKSRSFKLTGQKLRPLFKIRKSASVTANLSSDKHEKKPLNDEEKRPMTVTSRNGEDDRFFEQLSINQSRRDGEQQTCLYNNDGEPVQRSKRNSSANVDNRELNDLMDMLEGMQGSRMDDQRTDFPGLEETTDEDTPNMLSMRTVGHESFVDMIIRSQSSRIEDQRSTLPESSSDDSLSDSHMEDAFLQLIERIQSDRIDEQRSSIAELF